MFHVYNCSTCGGLFEGAAWRPTEHSRLPDGSLRPGYDREHGRDLFGDPRCDCPKFCSEECRDGAQERSA
jgi:hypothetical protein